LEKFEFNIPNYNAMSMVALPPGKLQSSLQHRLQQKQMHQTLFRYTYTKLNKT